VTLSLDHTATATWPSNQVQFATGTILPPPPN
jgi:hypothetical protein